MAPIVPSLRGSSSRSRASNRSSDSFASTLAGPSERSRSASPPLSRAISRASGSRFSNRRLIGPRKSAYGVSNSVLSSADMMPSCGFSTRPSTRNLNKPSGVSMEKTASRSRMGGRGGRVSGPPPSAPGRSSRARRPLTVTPSSRPVRRPGREKRTSTSPALSSSVLMPESTRALGVTSVTVSWAVWPRSASTRSMPQLTTAIRAVQSRTKAANPSAARPPPMRSKRFMIVRLTPTREREKTKRRAPRWRSPAHQNVTSQRLGVSD